MKYALTLSMTTLFMLGCAQTRTYPICFFDTSMTGKKTAYEAWPKSELNLENLLRQNVFPWNSNSVLIISSTVATAKTTETQHEKIQKYWPSIACFGDWTGDNIAKYQICKNYISTYLQYTAKGSSLPESTIIPQCQTLGQAQEGAE